MLDTRCWECAKETDEMIDELGISKRDIVDREYQGNGKFKCPRCGHILNLEPNTYHTIISIGIEKNPSIISTTVRKDGLDTFIQDLQDYRYLPKEPGVYDCEIYWHYYQCGGYEYPDEYDVDIFFFKEEQITLPIVQKKSWSWIKESESQKQSREMMGM